MKSLLAFIHSQSIALFHLLSTYSATSYISFKTWPVPLWNFPWLSLRQSQMIPAPVSRCCERIYHNVVQSLAYLTVVLLDKPWAYSKGEVFVFFVVSTQNSRRSMFVECIMNKWLYLKDWSRPLAPAFPVILRNSLNFNASFCSFIG